MDSIKINNSQDTFSIYNGFVDAFIKDANPSFIKVYIYIVRHSRNTDGVTYEKIAEDTGLLKSDVVNALKYWNKVGALTFDKNQINIVPITQKIQTSSGDVLSDEKAQSVQEPKEKMYQPNASVASSYRGAEVVKTVNSDKKLAHLFTLISQILNKSLSTNDYKIIYSFIDYLKLPEQVIIILFEYCVSLSKTNMRYVEKIAYSWADNGIITPQLANSFVKKSAREHSAIAKYKKNFRITGREFTDTEEKMLLTWLNEYKAGEELIMRAYDSAVMNTGKVSFRYMDSIIKNEISGDKTSKKEKLPSNVEKSRFRNYPSGNAIGDVEKEMIEKMMSQFGGDSDAVNE